MNFAGSLDRHFEGDAHRRIELIQGLGDDRRRHPQRLRSDTVEPFAGVEDSLGAPISDIIKGRLDEGSGVGQVHGGTRHLRAWIGGRIPHVDETEHGIEVYARRMEPQLPLFPLTTALVPGLVLPLHIFEPRYRMMIEELLAKPEDEREFGIVAVRERHVGAVNSPESAPSQVDEFFPVGVTAVLATSRTT